MKAEVANLEAVQADLEQVSDDIRDAVMGALEDGGRSIQTEARRLVEVDSGDLRKAISVRKKTTHVEVYVDTSKAHYGHFVEFGTHGGRRPAKPFMGPAAEMERKNIKRRVAKAVEDV